MLKDVSFSRSLYVDETNCEAEIMMETFVVSIMNVFRLVTGLVLIKSFLVGKINFASLYMCSRIKCQAPDIGIILIWRTLSVVHTLFKSCSILH